MDQFRSETIKDNTSLNLWTDEERLIVSFHNIKDFAKRMFRSEEELMETVRCLTNTGYKVQ